MEKDPCRGAVYLIVLCDHPYLVSVLFAVLLSLYLVTFLMFVILVIYWLAYLKANCKRSRKPSNIVSFTPLYKGVVNTFSC